MRKGLVRFVAALVIVAVILVIGLYTLTNTDWGREQVRKRIVGMLQENSHGIVKIGKVTGNLLKGFTLHDLSITDSAVRKSRAGIRSIYVEISHRQACGFR
jgi:autotransporter translocation and assembly factor TamB